MVSWVQSSTLFAFRFPDPIPGIREMMSEQAHPEETVGYGLPVVTGQNQLLRVEDSGNPLENRPFRSCEDETGQRQQSDPA
jgi:hypothetical protein